MRRITTPKHDDSHFDNHTRASAVVIEMRIGMFLYGINIRLVSGSDSHEPFSHFRYVFGANDYGQVGVGKNKRYQVRGRNSPPTIACMQTNISHANEYQSCKQISAMQPHISHGM